MACRFDRMIERLGTDSIKWGRYDDDVLPMWVADTDFRAAPEILAALHERVAHGIFGYAGDPGELKEVLCERLWARYAWHVAPDEIVMIPDVSVGFNLGCQAVGQPGEGIIMHTPIYHPMLRVPGNADMVGQLMRLDADADGRYTVDMDRFRRVISPCSRVFLLCSPHNPVGRVWTRAELEQMAAICLENDLYIVSDEIHGELLYPGVTHTPTAALAPEVAARTITLMAPSKTFNLAGLKCAFAIIQNAELRERYNQAKRGLMPGVNLLAYTAALAAYRDSGEWLEALLAYLLANREHLADFVAASCRECACGGPKAPSWRGWIAAPPSCGTGAGRVLPGARARGHERWRRFWPRRRGLCAAQLWLLPRHPRPGAGAHARRPDGLAVGGAHAILSPLGGRAAVCGPCAGMISPR